ncbi:hypothetical protein B0T19DRAFT_50760 [Cercophora scortea]|uniref:Uncharacterized protein n=1 Tax=Cercophora scortea TaxID=314031 RepID=A0AAE0J5V4_9PEZI|nr:hypothetical protein B0T19DRAFT_50760 [Cercophora scortea]
MSKEDTGTRSQRASFHAGGRTARWYAHRSFAAQALGGNMVSSSIRDRDHTSVYAVRSPSGHETSWTSMSLDTIWPANSSALSANGVNGRCGCRGEMKMHNFYCNQDAEAPPPTDHGSGTSTAVTPVATGWAATINTPEDVGAQGIQQQQLVLSTEQTSPKAIQPHLLTTAEANPDARPCGFQPLELPPKKRSLPIPPIHRRGVHPPVKKRRLRKLAPAKNPTAQVMTEPRTDHITQIRTHPASTTHTLYTEPVFSWLDFLSNAVPSPSLWSTSSPAVANLQSAPDTPYWGADVARPAGVLPAYGVAAEWAPNQPYLEVFGTDPYACPCGFADCMASCPSRYPALL